MAIVTLHTSGFQVILQVPLCHDALVVYMDDEVYFLHI